MYEILVYNIDNAIKYNENISLFDKSEMHLMETLHGNNKNKLRRIPILICVMLIVMTSKLH